MKIALVTSEVTYIPHNYDHLILPLLEHSAVVALIEVGNRSPNLLAKAMGLAVLGVKGVAAHLARNTLFPSSKIRRKKCQQLKKQYAKFESMNDQSAIDFLVKEKIDLVINLRTRCIYKEKVLQIPRLGCINVHHGILPKYRGTMCDLYALYEGRPAGFSVHKMEKRVDAGVIYRIQEVASGDMNYPEYLAKTNAYELEVLTSLIDEVQASGKLPDGTANTSNDKIHTKNPDRKLIKKMLNKGMHL